ncbi:hypothetical protein HII36_14080 [Nonomuraea sp. NN258]|uniref:hypothetical protein n=1 Tax=Nonomuraea antri TaxID=2730852 RepID=UPI001569FC0B|nr:hypothetical protein [Nonomuraea antri]NRQ32961.1 hypothetical protein [Nonomuraea antri]
MMATQEEINAARRTIELLRDQHANDVRKLIGLLESGAMKGKAADKLIQDCQGWEAAYRDVFRRALAQVESIPARPEMKNPLDWTGPPFFPPPDGVRR